MQVGEIPLIGVKSTQVMIGFGIDLYLIAATGNICEICLLYTSDAADD